MRILSVVRRGYYGSADAVEPMFKYFTEPLRSMGHEVETFDHFEISYRIGRKGCTEKLLEKIRHGFDLVLYQTSGGKQPVDTSSLASLSANTCIAAWNCDDDWQWDTCTHHIAPHFTFMITTYPSIYQGNKDRCPNLILSQWGCYEGFARLSSKKDIDFSFAGSVYGPRNSECRFLKRRAGLLAFGRGARLANIGFPYFRGAFKLPWIAGGPLSFEQIHEIWSRSRISYTPLKGGPGGTYLQVKGRVFEMGLAGTLMLCERNPALENYYAAGREYVEYASLEDCAEKAGYYLAHERERAQIAESYRQRTLKEHLWRHRFEDLFHDMNLRAVRSPGRKES